MKAIRKQMFNRGVFVLLAFMMMSTLISFSAAAEESEIDGHCCAYVEFDENKIESDSMDSMHIHSWRPTGAEWCGGSPCVLRVEFWCELGCGSIRVATASCWH